MHRGLVLGLTGNLGSGKSTVAGMLQKRGAMIVDADSVGHSALEPGTGCFRRVRDTFGESVLTPQGRIDRDRLAKAAFASSAAYKRLCRIVHPWIGNKLREQIRGFWKQDRSGGVLVIDAAVLITAGWHHYVDRIALVRATRDSQVTRIRKSGRLSAAAVRERLRFQLMFRVQRDYADFIIDNRGSLKATEKQVETMWQNIIMKQKEG